MTRAWRRIRGTIHELLLRVALRRGARDAARQTALAESWRQLAGTHALPSFPDAGFRVFSQTDEDGLLLFLFAILGTTDKRCVEICAGDGIECNTANLIVNHGWHGLLMDGSQRLVDRGRRLYARMKPSPGSVFACAWVTRDRVNALVASHGFEGGIDLLSLDLDGVDYWIWDALDVIAPRVVVLEYQDILGPDRSWTVPYSDDFSAAAYPMTHGAPNFAGASLSAFVKLGRRKGYRLVGVNSLGYNAFFVKNGLGDDVLPEIDTGSCFSHPRVVQGMRERFATVKNLTWVEI